MAGFEGNSERFLSVKEVSARLGVTPDAIYKRMRRNEFPVGYKFCATRRWKLSELEIWEAAHRVGA